MRLFRIPRRDRKLLAEERPMARFFRYMLVTFLFCMVFYGFWLNNERNVARVKNITAPAVVDATGTLTEKEEALLSEYIHRFREAYGIEIIISIDEPPFHRNKNIETKRGSALLLGIAPKSRGVVLEAPPLVASALGEPLVLYLRHAHFMPYFASGSWPKGLAEALNVLARRLDSVLGAAPLP